MPAISSPSVSFRPFAFTSSATDLFVISATLMCFSNNSPISSSMPSSVFFPSAPQMFTKHPPVPTLSATKNIPYITYL